MSFLCHASRARQNQERLGQLALPLPDYLTHSCMQILFSSVVWTFDTYEDTQEIKHHFINYLKESFSLVPPQDFSIKYFLEKVVVSKISAN